ncbi:MAG: SPOR domain-containing protein [Rhodospirillales bacterium]
MKKAALALVCTVTLSGCAMPVGVTVATWAADGWSLLTTNKSLLDHGISFVAEKDCALWRVFSDAEVCIEETEGGTALADASGTMAAGYASRPSDEALADYRALTEEKRPVTTLREVARASDEKPSGPVVIASLGDGNEYVDSSRSPWYRQTRNNEYLALMPESFKGAGDTTRPAAKLLPTKPAEITVASRQTASAPSLTVPADATAPAIDIEFAAFDGDNPPAVPVTPVETVMPVAMADASGGVDGFANPGRYFVIGSFQVWDNATRFAERHRSIGAEIHGATVSGEKVYRIVVGPYRPAEGDILKSAIAAAGIDGTWSVTVKEGARVVAWRTDGSEQLASLTAVPES